MDNLNINILVTRNVKVPYKLTMPFEDYIACVISCEMSESWDIGALMVQAICARSYGLKFALSGNQIADTSLNQAFKIRDLKKYPKCVSAAQATAGMVIAYNGKAITSYFCASNGGTELTPIEAGWRTNFPYLPHQKDPWTKASLFPKWGHGVGMSQRGTQWAIKHKVAFYDIIRFYYRGTQIALNYGRPIGGDIVYSTFPLQYPLLSKGDVGENVEKLQKLLNLNGAALTEDGWFGEKTRLAVLAYQKKKGLAKDGVAGTQTLTSLNW